VSKQKHKANGKHPPRSTRQFAAIPTKTDVHCSEQVRKVGLGGEDSTFRTTRNISLNKTNKATTASRAKEIYLSLRSAGWEPDACQI